MKLQVNGMSCGHCANAVTKAILTIDPNAKVEVDLQRKEVTINGSLSVDSAKEAIIEAGYEFLGVAE